jgi:hypothetical protein
METVAAIFTAFAKWIGWRQAREDRANTPEMQQGAAADAEQKAKDAAQKNVDSNNLDEVRKDIAD